MKSNKIHSDIPWITLYAEAPIYKDELTRYRADSDRTFSDRVYRLMLKAGMVATRPWTLLLAVGLVGLSASQTWI